MTQPTALPGLIKDLTTERDAVLSELGDMVAFHTDVVPGQKEALAADARTLQDSLDVIVSRFNRVERPSRAWRSEPVKVGFAYSDKYPEGPKVDVESMAMADDRDGQDEDPSEEFTSLTNQDDDEPEESFSELDEQGPTLYRFYVGQVPEDEKPAEEQATGDAGDRVSTDTRRALVVTNARPVELAQQKAPSRALPGLGGSEPTAVEVRYWAAQNGIEVGRTGRPSSTVYEAYRAAHA